MSASNISRRRFVTSAAAAATTAAVSGPALGALGANEKIRVGIIGSGGRGTSHATLFKQHELLEHTHKDAEIVVVCDVDPARTAAAAKAAGNKPEQVKDFRKVIDRKDVDAVFIATCGHWHAITALGALDAGKHVYCEKPMCHTVHEGRVMVDKVKATGRVFQVGTQQRSGPHWRHAVERLKAGEIGRITTVNVWNAWNTKELGGDLGNPPDSAPPPGVDYDMWLGPAPKRKFNRARWHSSFYFSFDYSGGMVSAWGVHLFDIVLWVMGPEINSVTTKGGIYVLKDARETPDTVQAVFDAGDYVMSYSLQHSNGWRRHGDMDHGIEFVGTKGVMQINRSGFQLYHENDRASRKPYDTEKYQGDSTLHHHRNFFDCIRTGKTPNSDVLSGHLGVIPCHLANISYRVGRSIRWDGEKETIPGDPSAAKLLTKEYRKPWHL